MRSASLTLFSLLVLAGCTSMRRDAMAPPPPAAPMPAATMATGPIPPALAPMNVRPLGPAPAWAPDIDPQMLAVVEQLMSYEQPPLNTLTAFQARNEKSPTNAVHDLFIKSGMTPAPPTVDVGHRVLRAGPPEGILVRTYTPLAPAPAGRARPVVVYYHGGGWVIANLETYEAGAMALAAQTGAVVVSVAYRQAPENRFPTQHEDAFAAYQWVVEHAAEIGGDANLIATAGESAGGNLAVAVAMMAKQRGVRMPVHILSVYPIADGDTQSPSYDRYAEAVPLGRAGMAWFFEQTLAAPADARNPMISLTRADLSGLPPTTIVNAEIDPLQSDGEELAAAMERAGVRVERRLFTGVTHEFFGMAAVLEQAAEAQAYAAGRLRTAFGR